MSSLNDILPVITIAVPVTPLIFIEQMKQIGASLQIPFTLDTDKDETEDSYVILSFKDQNSKAHSSLVAQLITIPRNTKHVNVEMRATRWSIDPLTYEVYSDTATAFFLPILARYREIFGAPVRLSIQPKSATEPKLPPQAKRLFDAFVIAANKVSLHPYDWNRFYVFIRFCHSKHVKLSEHEVERLLWREGFGESQARYIANVYRHCRDFIKAV